MHSCPAVNSAMGYSKTLFLVAGLASYGLYSWWSAPPSVAKYSFDSAIVEDEVEELVRKRRRGTRGKGRKINYPEPITECSLEGVAISLLVGARRTAAVYKDVQVRLQATVRLEGCSINGTYYPAASFSPTKVKQEDGSTACLEAAVSPLRLSQAIMWSINRAKVSDEMVLNRLSLAGNWVDEWMYDQDATTITGSWTRARLWAEWKVRTSLGLDLPLPSQ